MQLRLPLSTGAGDSSQPCRPASKLPAAARAAALLHAGAAAACPARLNGGPARSPPPAPLALLSRPRGWRGPCSSRQGVGCSGFRLRRGLLHGRTGRAGRPPQAVPRRGWNAGARRRGARGCTRSDIRSLPPVNRRPAASPQRRVRQAAVQACRPQPSLENLPCKLAAREWSRGSAVGTDHRCRAQGRCSCATSILIKSWIWDGTEGGRGGCATPGGSSRCSRRFNST